MSSAAQPAEIARGPWEHARRYAPAVLLLVTCALLSLRVFAFINRYAVNVLYLDQWDFYTPLFEGGSFFDEFRYQHSPHRMGIGLPLMGLVARVSDWDSRWDSYSVALCMLAAAAAALLLKHRLFGKLEVWDVAIPLVFINLRQFSIFTTTPNLALNALPVLLVLGFGLALTLERLRVRYAALLVINFLCIYTGFAIFMGAVTPAVLVLAYVRGEAGSKLTTASLAIAVASFASFFVGYDFEALRQSTPNEIAFVDYLNYMNGLFASSVGARAGWYFQIVPGLAMMGIGLVLLTALAPRRSEERGSPALGPVIVSLILFSAVFAVGNTAGRVSLGAEYAHTPRYIPFLLPAFFALYLGLLRLPAPALRGALALLYLGVLASAELRAVPAHLEYIENIHRGKRAWAECARAEKSRLELCNARAGFEIYPWREQYPRIQARLEMLRERRLNLFKARPSSEAGGE